MAEHLFRKLLQERDEELAGEIEVTSAGLGRMNRESLKFAKDYPWYAFKTWLKKSPDKNISSVMLERGFDVSKHKSRKLKKGWVEEANLIITMEKEQKEKIFSQYPSAKGKVFTLKEISGETDSSDISDPAGSSLEESKNCVGEIENCLKEGMERIICLSSWPVSR